MTQLEQLQIFEQYEYKGWLITIGEKYGKDLLYGFAQPLKYSKIYSYDDYEAEFHDDEKYFNELERKVIEAGIVPSDYFTSEIDNGFYISLYHVVEPFEDTENFLRSTDVSSPTSILSTLLSEIECDINTEPGKTRYFKPVPSKNLKSLKKYVPKSENKKPPRKARGFNNLAWATLVKLRDGNCTICQSSDDLHAHHIKSYKSHPELRYDVNNGTTLCAICHRQHHKLNGK
jgi:hypothetical protein